MSLALYLSRVRSSDLLGGILSELHSIQAKVVNEARCRHHLIRFHSSLVANDIAHFLVNAHRIAIGSPEAVELRNQIDVHVTDGRKLCRRFVRDLEAEPLFDRHEELYSV
jgi:hypothetical protein